jgi:hypothetical protein
VFGSVFIDDESGTVAWPGGIDLGLEALYREIRRRQLAWLCAPDG